MNMLLTGIVIGFFIPFALYGIYRLHLCFSRPSDMRAVISRVEYEKERIIQEGAKRTLEYRN